MGLTNSRPAARFGRHGPDPPPTSTALHEAVRKRMNFLHGVRVRMYRLGAADGDPVFDLPGQCERAMQRLSDELRNRSIPSGERRPWEPSGYVDEDR